MAHTRDEGLKVVSGTESSSSREAEAPRPSGMRTPPRVWPQVSQADMGRVVRRLRGTAEHVREPEPRVRLVGKTG